MKLGSLISKQNWEEFKIQIDGCSSNSRFGACNFASVISFKGLAQEHISWINYDAIALIDVNTIQVDAYETVYEYDISHITAMIATYDIDGMVNAITDNEIKPVENPVKLTVKEKNDRIHSLVKAFIKASSAKIIVSRGPMAKTSHPLHFYQYRVPKSKEKTLFKLMDDMFASAISSSRILVDRITIYNGFIYIDVCDDLYDLIANTLMTLSQRKSITPEYIEMRMKAYYKKNSSKEVD